MDYQHKNYKLLPQPYATPGQERQVYVNQPCPKPNTPIRRPAMVNPYIRTVPTPVLTGRFPALSRNRISKTSCAFNKGKVGTFYFTYTDSNEWRDRVYKGVIEAAGRDHLIISDPKTGKRPISYS